MAAQKSFLSRLLTRLLIFLLVIVMIVTGGYLFVRFYYGVDLITTIGQVSKLTRAVDVSSFTNTFNNEDKAELMTNVNDHLLGDDYIVYNEETQVYSVNNDANFSIPTPGTLPLSDKQCGALIDIFMANSANTAQLDLGGVKVGFNLVQVKFSNLHENSVDFNVVIKLDLRDFKAKKLSGFPLSWIGKKIPDYNYLSSTVTVTKDTTDTFKYTISNGRVAINALNEKETADLFNSLKKFVNFTSADALAQQFTTPFVNAFIGKENSFGSSIGHDFEFVQSGEAIKLDIEITVLP